MQQFDVIVIGAGPAGLSAGIYLARARQKVLILDQGMPGGQVILTHAVANYPGVPEMTGYQLAAAMKKQAQDFGCTILPHTRLQEFNLQGEYKTVTAGDQSYSARAVVLALGGEPRRLGLESELRLQGRGISYCATCDGDFFTGQDIVVVGGGNSALEEAVSLTRYASTVTIVHQFDHFQAYAHAVQEAEQNPKIRFITESDVIEFLGEESLNGVRIHSKRDGTEQVLPASGAFIFIGYSPRTAEFAGCVSVNERGEILAGEDMATSRPGVFVAGDARSKRYRQITTAVSDGTVAALSAMEYLESRKRTPA